MARINGRIRQAVAERRRKVAAARAKLREPEAQEVVSRQVCDRVRELRKKKGWTLEQLASLSGVSRSMLSQIERGAANPTLGVAYRIAQAFSLTLGDLVEGPPRRPQIDVIRSEDPRFLFRSDEAVRIRTLSPLDLEKDVEFYEVEIQPGGALRSEAHFAGTREFLTIEKGKVRLTAGDQSTELQKGDSAHYPADLPHSIENLGRTAALAFLVDIYQTSSTGRP